MNRKKTQVTICVGAGGVGKTTVASMLGIHYAQRGEKTLVITVDPALRLLDALNITERSSEPIKINIDHLATEKARGQLFAYMPDLKQEWMNFLQAAIKRTEHIHEIAHNPFYQYVSEGLPGAFEIICSHILFRFIDQDYDRIVLDTPPSSQSLAFFDVPNNVGEILKHSIFKTYLKKRSSFLTKITKKLALLSGNVLEHTLERLIGSHFLSKLLDFALTIDELYEPMLERVQKMDALLKDKDCHYVAVVRPTIASVEDYCKLKDELIKRDISINRIVVNQALTHISQAILAQEFNQAQSLFANQIGKIERMLSIYQQQVAFEIKLMEYINEVRGNKPMHILFIRNPQDQPNFMGALLDDFSRVNL